MKKSKSAKSEEERLEHKKTSQQSDNHHKYDKAMQAFAEWTTSNW